MNLSVLRPAIQGNIEALKQGLALLSSLSDDHYCHIARPLVNSSIGEHFRHVADMFAALISGLSDGAIDYDARRRGCGLESDRSLAIAEFHTIVAWMENLEAAYADEHGPDYADILVHTEVCLSKTQPLTLASNLVRELVFVSSHAVHHYALIGVIAKLQGVKMDEYFGVAPATASHLRDCASQDDAHSTFCQTA